MKQRRKQGIRSIMAMLVMFAMVMSSMPTLNIKAQSNDETTSWGDDYKVTVTTPSQWYNGYNANITITNTSEHVIHNWHLVFYLADDITDLWNAQVVSNEEGIYVIKNDVTNQDIPVGESVSFGFTASNTLDVNLPTSYFMPTNTVSIDEATYQVNYALKENWDTGFTASLEIMNKSVNDFTDWTLEFDYDNKDQTFWEATLTSEEKSHIILNNLNYNQNIKKGEFLTLDFIGYPGDETKVPYGFKMSQIVFDESLLELDTDGDGLINRQELYLGSNPYNMDSDGDGLNDYFEVMYGLDPLLVDSDSNGISDPVEDMDNDGLTVMEEYLLGTNIWDEDTDYDGLTDGDEVNKYYTNPLLEDTDEDGLLDGDEILLGLNPLVKDTDNNGILDGDEKIQQEISVPIEDDVHKEITKVEVSMKGTGNIQNNTSITNTMGKDMLSSDVVGLIGVPVEIESTSKFDQATITFTYDDSLLGDTKEDDLSLMWYDEEHNQYVILNDDSIVDTKNNTVSYVTTHFSTYMVVDSAKWYEVWSNALSYRRGSGVAEGSKEFFDMSYVIDRSGSMSGSRITLAKESIQLFIDAMIEKDRASIVQFDSTAVVKSGFSNDKELLKRLVNTITASGGTSVDAGLTKAFDLFDNEKDSKNSKIIVLLCDGDVNYTNQTLKRAKDKKIKIYTVLIGSTSGMASLDKLAKETGGKSYYAASAEEIREAIFGVQRNTVGIVDTTDTDGDGLPDIFETAGMILPNGKYVYTDPKKKDTDGDGIPDNEEMGIQTNFNNQDVMKKISLKLKGFDETIYAEYFNYKSDPTKKDSDKDGYNDKIDKYPLVAIEDMSYIFYEKGGDKFLKDEADSREKKISKKKRKATVIAVNTVTDFEKEWNNMGVDSHGLVEFEIDTVYTIFHGSPNRIYINENKNDILYHTQLNNLNDKKIKLLYLSSCNNGNLDWLNTGTYGKTTFTQNMAISFLKQCSGIQQVKAWDGYAIYKDIWGAVFEFSVGYEDFWRNAFEVGEFETWSKNKNGRIREVGGLITYQWKNGNIVCSPPMKFYGTLKSGETEIITEIIK